MKVAIHTPITFPAVSSSPLFSIPPMPSPSYSFQRFSTSSANSKVLNEWENLQSIQRNMRPMNFSAANSNRNKNRYPDILPYDKNRVILSKSNYINASKMNIGEKNFICCQAPLPQTFCDFWSMVWENKTPVIVMLTKLIEGKKIKAHCYWPTALGHTEYFGEIFVQLESMESDDKMTKRIFKVGKIDEQETLQVLHIHYTEWPDFGVPDSPKNIIKVIEDVENFREYVKASPAAPVIVHCSAGIGRTGTYLAISAYFNHKKQSLIAPLSIQDVVNNLRDQRMGMVQTVEQYSFIYQAIESL